MAAGGDRDRDGGRDLGDRGPRSGGGFRGGAKTGRDRGLPKPPIQEIFKRGQEVIVQVIKEAIGTKGPTLSTYISIAGRYLVLMPSLNRVGVSRKIEDHDARRRLREIMTDLSPPKGVGFIVRTAAIDRDAKELRNDLAYLLRLWQVVVKRIKRVSGPVEIYRESDMITRTIRDIFTNDIDTIWVDEATAFAHASEFLQIVMPKFASRIRYFESTEPLFHKYGVEDEIAKIHQKRIEMPLGGSLVIEQTEALVAIDVNSGNFRADNNAEETAFQMNLHAAKEIARQLRLRDLGGVIVNDFIDMRGETHRRKVEDALPRGAAARPCPDQDSPHLAVRPHRDDPAAHPPEPEAQHLLGLPALPRHGVREDQREPDDRCDAAIATRCPPCPGDRIGAGQRSHGRGPLSAEQAAEGTRRAGRTRRSWKFRLRGRLVCRRTR